MLSWSNATRTESRRRSSHAAVVAVLVVVLAVLVACQNSLRASAAQHSSIATAPQKNYFTYGMTKKQVVRIIGHPKSIRGNYWYYPVVHGEISGKVRVVVYGTNIVMPTANQFRIFWYAGQLQGEEIHVKVPVKGYIWRGIIL